MQKIKLIVLVTLLLVQSSWAGPFQCKDIIDPEALKIKKTLSFFNAIKSAYHLDQDFAFIFARANLDAIVLFDMKLMLYEIALAGKKANQKELEQPLTFSEIKEKFVLINNFKMHYLNGKDQIAAFGRLTKKMLASGDLFVAIDHGEDFYLPSEINFLRQVRNLFGSTQNDFVTMMDNLGSHSSSNHLWKASHLIYTRYQPTRGMLGLSDQKNFKTALESCLEQVHGPK